MECFMKVCKVCLKSLDESNFYVHSKHFLRAQCKECRKLIYPQKSRRKVPILPREEAIRRQRTAQQLWRKNNLEYDAFRAQYRRAMKRQAVPSWANKSAILEIYKNCPEGYHVDHIVPLQSKIVSGLHWEGNLQYLPARENEAKGNRYWENMP